ncbi:MAG: hypothetical protein K6C08_10465, partial [Oscillospiraceae bacterium]|nr:hypothetical protein [Oscillospiraceae bacterium]
MKWEVSVTFFSVLFLNSCFSFVEIIFFEIPGMALVQVVGNFGLSLFTTIPLPMLTVFLLHSCGENWQKSPLFRAELTLYAVYFVMVVIAQFNALIYYVTPDG